MRVIRLEDVDYVVLERGNGPKEYVKDKKVIETIKKGLERGMEALNLSLNDLKMVNDMIEIALDVSDEAACGILCYEEDTEGY